MQRASRLAYLILLSYSCLLAGLVVQRVDELAPLGGDWVLQISGELNAPAAEITAALRQAATEQGAALVQIESDIRDPGGLRHAHVVAAPAGSEPTRWLESGYPAFSRRMRTEMHPEAAPDPRGFYLVFGSEAALAQLSDVMRAHGLVAHTQAFYEPTALVPWLMQRPLGYSLVIMTLLCALLVGVSVVLDVLRYAVQRLHGAGFGRLVLGDLLGAGRFLLVAAPAVWAGAGVVLWAYNGGHHGLAVAGWAACFTLAMAVVVAVAHLVALVTVTKLAILESLKGKVMTSWGMALVYGIRIPAAVLAASTLVVLWGQAVQLHAYDRARAAWAAASDTVSIGFSARVGVEEEDRLSLEVGRWLVAEEQAGRMILCHHQEQLTDLAGSADRPLLLVNDAYLRRHEVLDEHGTPIRSAPPGQVLVLVPAALAAHTDQVRDRVAGSLLEPDVNVVTGQTRDGQSLFRYGAVRLRNLDAFAVDPIVVVANSTTGAIRQDDYMSYASQGGVLLTDWETSARAANDYGLASFILAYTPVSRDAAKVLAEEVRELRVTATSEMVAVVVLVATAIGAATLYTRSRYQRTFVRYLSGWTFAATHRLLLVVELGVVLLVVGTGIVWARIHSKWEPISPWTVPSVAGLGLAGFGVVVVALAVVARRLVRTRSSEA